MPRTFRQLISVLANWYPLFFSAIFILRSRPFLKLPYDMWHHLMLIRGWLQDGQPFLTRPGTSYHEVLWHRLWADFFRFIHVSDVFLWAKIIHCSQFFWTLWCLSYFTGTILKYWCPYLPHSKRRLLSLLGAWCFVFGAGTFSGQYQLSWMLWYGVNYQATTLPAYFLASGLLIDTFLSPWPGISIPRLLAIPVIFSFIIVVHPMEASYFLIMLVGFASLFPFEISKKIANSPVAGVTIFAPLALAPLMLFLLPKFGIELPRPSGISLIAEPTALLERLKFLGHLIQSTSGHRGLTSFNELAIFGCFLLVVITLSQASVQLRAKASLNSKLRLGIFITLASIGFAIVPRLEWTSGFFALLTSDEHVWRFALASPWFLGFALWGSLVLNRQMEQKLATCFTLAPIILVFSLSRFVTSGPFNSTASSVIRSLELIGRHDVSIQYDRKALKSLESLVLSTPLPPPPKKNIFLIRADLQTYIRAATGAYVLGDRLGPLKKSAYDELADRDNYKLIIISPPVDLPLDMEMARAFPSMGLLTGNSF